MLVVATNLKFNILGLVCSLNSTLIFVAQNIFSKKLVSEAAIVQISTAPKLNKLNLLFYSSSFAFLFMLPLWLYYDGGNFYRGNIELNLKLIYLLSLNGMAHFSQSILAFSVLALVSPITYSIASLCKRIFVITASIIYFSDSISFIQGCGILITFIGLRLYHKAEQEVNKNEEMVFSNERFISLSGKDQV
jgi:drug/metabolite transporter (DMT)-like permease